jgi:1-acyl-sn-glycerol-3-phosphate acyltransferase
VSSPARRGSALLSWQQAVALGMVGYVRARFRLRTFGIERASLAPGTIIAPNHRSDHDVPLLVAAMRAGWSEGVAAGARWPAFAADDHIMFRGFLAGYPDGLPLLVRRLVWPVRVGGVLERHLGCVPVRRPAQMRVVELLQRAPEASLDGQLPPEVRDALDERARALGRAAPRRGADALAGVYADILWTVVEHERAGGGDAVWRAHVRDALSDFQRLATTLQRGGVVVLFPEGQLIRDGTVGPFAAGLASLARKGRARAVLPVAIAYDPLTAGRARAYVSVGAALDPAEGAIRQRSIAAVCGAIPLTPGQIAASVLRDSSRGGDLAAAGERWIARAARAGRPVEPELLGPGRARALETAFEHARDLGLEHTLVRALARELQSADGGP